VYSPTPNPLLVDGVECEHLAFRNDTGFASGYDVAVQLDPASIKVVVGADSNLILQVISNLLSNAVKFFQSGGEVFVKVKNLGTMGRCVCRKPYLS
jgi:signal transduction histidine kinase